jgi:hypothetical protein
VITIRRDPNIISRPDEQKSPSGNRCSGASPLQGKTKKNDDDCVFGANNPLVHCEVVRDEDVGGVKLVKDMKKKKKVESRKTGQNKHENFFSMQAPR